MENTRFLKLVIIALLLINVGMMAFMWLGKPMEHRPGGPPPQGGPFNYLCKELQLDDKQIEQYSHMRDEHHQSVVAMQQRGRLLRGRLFDMLHSSPVDSGAVKRMTDSIAGTQEAIEQVTFYHFQKLRSILRPEQQSHFDAIIQDALQMMGGPPPR